TFTSETDKLAPIRRGKFIRDAILCDTPPPPPKDVPQLSDMNTGLTVREELAEHRQSAACSGCHEKLEPLGFGLERYDIVGQYRLNDANGLSLTGEGTISGLDKPDFVGAVELGQHLKAAPQTSQCFVRHMLRFAYDRSEEPNDACELQKLD